MSWLVRHATASDATTIADYNTAMARETEQLGLRPERISAGVRHLITHPELGFYLVAAQNGQSGQGSRSEQDRQSGQGSRVEPAGHAGSVIGCLLVTTEWSDWRNGLFWWIQSVYVHPEHRQRGVYTSLYAKVKSLAAESPRVGYRLYVEQDNRRAQGTYQKLGMSETHYRLYEELKPGQSYFLESGS